MFGYGLGNADLDRHRLWRSGAVHDAFRRPVVVEREGQAGGRPGCLLVFQHPGGLVLTVYAIHRNDPVFIFGQGLGLIIYFRNLHLHYKGKGREAAS
jgi:hypothetical protein